VTHTTLSSRRSGGRRRGLILAAAALVVQLLSIGATAEAASSVYLDAPRAGAVVGADFHLGGWAIDWASTSGTGIQTVHVWAYPASGAAPIFLGVPRSGARPDVAAAFGANFLNCGFGLSVHGLPPGDYMVAIFPYSVIRGGFDFGSAISVNIRVAAAPAAPAAVPTSSTAGGTLRVLQWNSHHGGYGTDGVYSPDRLATWIVKMKPDLISLNEIERFSGFGNEDQPALFASLLTQKTGVAWYYRFASSTGATTNTNGNLILSRFPLAAADEILMSYGRSAVQVTVMVNGRRINFLSTHLDATSGTERSIEMGELNAWANGLPEQRIIAGDFNAWPGAAETGRMTAGYTDTWAQAVKDGTAIAYAANPAGNTKKSRIDYIFTSHGASGLVLQHVQVFDTSVGGVMPSDHRPVLATFGIR
jgi:endonuclease/exonuclease/phosphatase family metal-dependent hydrolase